MNLHSEELVELRNGFTPDWTARWTAEVAELELVGFSFKGLGWYPSSSGDTILVLPTELEDVFKFCVYSWDPRQSFSIISRMPDRTR